MKMFKWGWLTLNQGAGSNEFITQMETMNNQLANSKNSSYISFNNYSSVDAAKKAINQGKINGAFVIPPGFSNNVTNGQPGNVIINVDNSNPQVAATVEQASSSTISGLNGITATTNLIKLGNESNPPINPQAIIAPYTANIENTIPGASNYFNFLAPGLIVMIGMMYIMNGIPETISKEKEIGTFDGMLSAPIHHLSIILGKAMGLTIRGLVQCAFVLVFAVLLFGVTVQGSLLLISVLTILGIFSFIGIGIMAVSLAKDQVNCIVDNGPTHVPYDVSEWCNIPITTDALVHAGDCKGDSFNLCRRCYAKNNALKCKCSRCIHRSDYIISFRCHYNAYCITIVQ